MLKKILFVFIALFFTVNQSLAAKNPFKNFKNPFVLNNDTRAQELKYQYGVLKKDEISVISNKENGKYAKLEYEVIENKNNLSLVKVNLITGRHHQIRLQFKSRGYSLYGDQLYGRKDKKQIALFAYHIKFKHPVKDEIMDFKLLPQGGIWETFKYEA